ncbi:hypothetical protein [Synechococcus sp. M16CYN]|uniref:hypothetical protein n=1 Tax=Synechococcus sp. M16CYN TaxID=3103139 RepID=UPI0033429705
MSSSRVILLPLVTQCCGKTHICVSTGASRKANRQRPRSIQLHPYRRCITCGFYQVVDDHMLLDVQNFDPSRCCISI